MRWEKMPWEWKFLGGLWQMCVVLVLVMAMAVAAMLFWEQPGAALGIFVLVLIVGAILTGRFRK